MRKNSIQLLFGHPSLGTIENRVMLKAGTQGPQENIYPLSPMIMTMIKRSSSLASFVIAKL